MLISLSNASALCDAMAFTFPSDSIKFYCLMTDMCEELAQGR